MDVLKEFERLGNKASYHYADDSGKEWDEGYRCKREAVQLYLDHPDYRGKMQFISQKFLWVLDRELSK